MIYSDLFDAMPAAVRDRVYSRLHDILTGQNGSPKYAALSALGREALRQIVRDTKSNLPDGW
jgi:hypothetical protein